MSRDYATLRILDASLNRASEGLRVVEDYARFVLDDAHLTELLKGLRHELAAAGGALPWLERLATRDTLLDVGTTISTPSEGQRADAWDVCMASFERLKQALRSLEEYAKVLSPELGGRFEALRYRLYTIEAAMGRTADAATRLADVRLYVLVDGRESEAEFASLIGSLIGGGVDAIQFRDKKLCDRELLARARLLVSAARGGDGNTSRNPSLRGRGKTPLVVINDRADVAAIVDADGVHLGQDDMVVKDARAVLGPRKLIGASTHSIEQARQAVLAGANYLGVGPTFPSQTKQFEQFPGPDLLRQVAAEIRLPAFAIGGITRGNLAEVKAAGFSRIAVSSAVTAASDPAAAASSLRSALVE